MGTVHVQRQAHRRIRDDRRPIWLSSPPLPASSATTRPAVLGAGRGGSRDAHVVDGRWQPRCAVSALRRQPWPDQWHGSRCTPDHVPRLPEAGLLPERLGGGCGPGDPRWCRRSQLLDRGGASAYTDPVELAFLDAYEAGISLTPRRVTAAPVPATAKHAGPWTNTVGASTSNRHFVGSLTIRRTTATPSRCRARRSRRASRRRRP